MKENKKTWFIIIGVALLIALLIFLLTHPRKKEYNTFVFPSTIIVENGTTNRMSDTISMAILNKVMEYDTMTIQIFPMPSIFMNSFIGIITKVNFEKHRYVVFLQNGVNIEIMKVVLSHEFVHLKQYELGTLQTLPNSVGYVWKGDTVKYIDVKYEDRPYEIEAFSQGPHILNKLNKILYKK